MKLTLGPIMFHWSEEMWRDFYFRVADEADVDTVVLGEVVCSKRTHFHEPDYDAVLSRLRAAGKQVRLSSLALVTLNRELRATRYLAVRDDVEIEANDISAHMALRGKRHAIGPLMNVYNAVTARVLAGRGATTICLPPELPLASMARIAEGAFISIEAFGFGRLPLAISARCAHARLKGLTKDNCQFVCGQEPDGLVVDTLDDQEFLALNGVQTMSATYHSTITDLESIEAAGVTSLRLSPQVCDMVAVARVFRSALNGELAGAEAEGQLLTLCSGQSFSNGFLHDAPGHHLIRAPN